MNSRPQNPQGTDIGICVLLILVAVAFLLGASGSLAAWLSGQPQPRSGMHTGLTVLKTPAEPGKAFGLPHLHPVVYWATLVVLAGITTIAAWVAWRAARRLQDREAINPKRVAGTATSAEIAMTASNRALMKRAATLRPSLSDPRPQDIGYRLGTGSGRTVWATVEDAMLLIGPPRSGKGLHLVINMILDAPGAVVTTSTRPDNLTTTLRARERRGPVAVFDPQRLAPGVPSGMRWSPVRGCEDPLFAMIRAAGFAAATGLSGGGVENGGFWEAKTRVVVQALLHAAALDGRGATDLYQWALNPSAAAEAIGVLESDPRAADGWADSLAGIIHSDPRTRDSVWHGVSLAFAALADPRVLDAVTPTAGDCFDPESFLRNNGALYLLATGAGAGASAPLVAALIEDIVEVARRMAAASPGARLDPPLLMALDEIGNLAPLPSLPVLMAEGGGTGITTVPVLQSMAQAREKWGEQHANAIWDASIVKVVLGGGSNPRDLQDLSHLIGELDETTDSTTIDTYGGRSMQRSVRRVPILPPERLRTLPFGTGIVLLRTARPIIAALRPWNARAEASTLEEQRAELEQLIQVAAR